MTRQVLITGISGFIAKHIALKFLTAGHSVRGTVRRLDRGDEVRAALAPHLDAGALRRLTFVVCDLEQDAGWPEAMAGIEVLVHTASPFPITQPKDEQDLIRPAVVGTLRALTAARAAGVKRVVLTSSAVAVLDGSDAPQDEANWCNLAARHVSAYAKSKTLAERSAWDFVKAAGMALTTINPGFVLGPPLDKHYGSSVGVVRRILRGRDPMVPMIGFACVDVRDVAEMHLLAVEKPDTAGRRYLAVAGSMTMPDMARVLKAAYPGRRIATRVAPKFVVQALALFDPQIRSILPEIGKMAMVSNARAKREMAMSFIPVDAALQASAAWLIAAGEV